MVSIKLLNELNDLKEKILKKQNSEYIDMNINRFASDEELSDLFSYILSNEVTCLDMDNFLKRYNEQYGPIINSNDEYLINVVKDSYYKAKANDRKSKKYYIDNLNEQGNDEYRIVAYCNNIGETVIEGEANGFYESNMNLQLREEDQELVNNGNVIHYNYSKIHNDKNKKWEFNLRKMVNFKVVKPKFDNNMFMVAKEMNLFEGRQNIKSVKNYLKDLI